MLTAHSPAWYPKPIHRPVRFSHLRFLINVATTSLIEVEFDPEKNRRNIRERGVDFELARAFDWDSALAWPDTRQDYGGQVYRPGTDP